jgi:hypothetical protein
VEYVKIYGSMRPADHARSVDSIVFIFRKTYEDPSTDQQTHFQKISQSPTIVGMKATEKGIKRQKENL